MVWITHGRTIYELNAEGLDAARKTWPEVQYSVDYVYSV